MDFMLCLLRQVNTVLQFRSSLAHDCLLQTLLGVQTFQMLSGLTCLQEDFPAKTSLLMKHCLLLQ